MINLIDIGKKINARLVEVFTAQGHHLTGAWEQSLRLEQNGTELICTAAHYTKFLEEGVPAERIPYSPGSGAKSSKYISALANYAKLRNMASDDRGALSVAFAIARKQLRDGMPTAGSRRFSSTGKRTDIVTDTLNTMKDVILQQISSAYLTEIQTTINNQIRGLKV